MANDNRAGIGITLELAVNEVGELIEDAMDFRTSILEPSWAIAERYYNGVTDLQEFEGRSNVVKTEVRDAIRNSMPSVMRVLMHAHKPVEFLPSSVEHAPWIEQQAEYCASLFYKNDGYIHLYNSVQEAFKLKIGVLKAFWEREPLPEYFHYTGVPFSVIEEMIADPLITVDEFTEAPSNVTQLGGGAVDLYEVRGYREYENGKIILESVPNYEFFISGEANSIEQALRQGVHGQSYITTVSEALDLGLDYDDWLTLDAEDPELSDHGESSAERRGYSKDAPNDQVSSDLLRHKFLLTEAYVQYDLEGTGRPQTYRFYLGGSGYTYIDHVQVDDSPFAIISPIPQSHTVYGHAIADLLINEQDTSSSLLRASIDNAHAANDAKIAADPTKTSFDDLMNPALNAPIRKRSGDTLQVIQIPFTGQGTLGMLQYLDQDNQNKIGVTKAAQGLDPDAMQSTDKQAVLNTIMTSQGQTELMVRNIIETGLIRLFRRLLKLSVQHQSPIQLMKTKGKVIPVDTRFFDPDAVAVPGVGLGTASPMQKQAALSMVLQKQEVYMEKFGPNNPFTSFAQIYNALEDLLEANGVHDTSRYFNVVTPGVEKAWAAAEEKRRMEQLRLAQENQPMDPSKAYMQIEEGKREIDRLKTALEQRNKERDRMLTALSRIEELDLKRDDLIQKRDLEAYKIGVPDVINLIRDEQASNEKLNLSAAMTTEKLPEAPSKPAPSAGAKKAETDQDDKPSKAISAPGRRMTR